MRLATLARHQWTSPDYERMLAVGVFEKIEFLCGDVVITGAVVRPYRWTLDDYEQLIALGLLEGKHVELMQGEILTMASMGEPQALTIMQLNYALLPHFNPGTGFHICRRVRHRSLKPWPSHQVIHANRETTHRGGAHDVPCP
jgi:hypothetical protein